jgi:predicted nucleotidyltransferase
MKKEIIMQRLKSDYDMLVEKGYEVVGVFLQGSQNYQLDYEGSDIDTKAILLPSFEDFLLNKKMISTTIELELSKEHVDIKDIRLMFENFKKQNINFIEILYTEYVYMNPKYEKLFNPMFNHRDSIARYDVYKTLNSISGMSVEKFKAMEHPYPSLIHKIEKFGFDGKQVSHILRLHDFIQKYTDLDHYSYSDCLLANDRDYLIAVKRNLVLTLEEARILSKETCDRIYVIAKDYMSQYPNSNNREVVDRMMNEVMVDIFRLRFKEELNK